MPKKHATNVLLDAPHRAALFQLAKHLDISMGAVIRRAIRFAYTFHVLQQPTCANGGRCLVPHMHPKQPDLPGHNETAPLPIQFE